MNCKRAFTLVEVLVTIAIIGIVSTFGILTVQKFDKGIRYQYSNIYHNINRALYNAMNFANMPDPFVESDSDDDEVTPAEGAQRLCNMLAAYINTVNTSCTADNLADVSGTSFGTVKMLTITGAKFYITQRLPEVDNPRKQVGDHSFFIIYVDINGDTPPNSMHYEMPTAANDYKTVDPDIFAFAALDIGRVCPLGPPEIDPRYMQTRIAYTSVAENEVLGDEVVTRYTVASRPYIQSKAEAWGYYLNGTVEQDRNPIDDEPYSYNDYIRYILPQNTQIYSFLNGAERITVGDAVHLRSENIANGGLGCVNHSGEECWVIIDRYVY